MEQIPTTVRRWLRSERVGRRFDYDRGLLPNGHLRTLEPSGSPPAAPPAAAEEAHYVEFVRWLGDSGMSMGYPSWNLLYYSMISSLLPGQENPVVVETGTNRGLSTIVMAQALRDLGLDGVVETVDFDPDLTATAQRHVTDAGLADRVRFHTGDSIEFLDQLVERVPHLDFVFLDDSHDRDHVIRQLDIVCRRVAGRRGKIYFDNAGAGGVAEALPYLKETYGGNLVEFANCSMSPSGNAIWQPD